MRVITGRKIFTTQEWISLRGVVFLKEREFQGGEEFHRTSFLMAGFKPSNESSL